MAAYLAANFSRRCSLTNEQVALDLGYTAANVLSLWKTGKSRVPLDRLPGIARLMRIDIAELLPLWIEQHAPDTPRTGVSRTTYEQIQEVFERIATAHEAPLLKAIRAGLAANPTRALTADELKAHKLLAADPSLATVVLTAAK